MNELELLARQVGANERTLRRAFNEGTLRAERPTPRKLKLDAAEKQYLRRSWKLLGALREALRTEQNVRFALLFGSAARGDDSEESDVDLIVEMRDSSSIRIVDLELKLEELLGRHVDVLTLEDASANPVLVAEAVAEGRTIVDREARWARLSSEAEAMDRRARRHLRERSRRALAGINRLVSET
ncbi:MAG TPA: nucleotidyltransferase domain-containing protein [Solirubrobacterales bacterium]|jgi:predicted nucleotidyltransferase|nr:nucleotidyltransferase domain-containing protein [Solirubrobacterales bacterium]